MSRQKFFPGDKVILKRRWQIMYNGIGDSIGTVIEVEDAPGRLKYWLVFEGKKFSKSAYSYQLDLVRSVFD
jgi:hypothetical protein